MNPERLALERLVGGGVVEKHDAQCAAGELLEAVLERCHLLRGLAIEPPQERLAEVRQRDGRRSRR